VSLGFFLSVEPRFHARDKVTQHGRYAPSCCEGQHLLRHLVGIPPDESGGSGTFSRSLMPVMLCKFDEIRSDRGCGQPNKDSRLVDREVYHSVVQSDGVYTRTLCRSSIPNSELEFHTIGMCA